MSEEKILTIKDLEVDTAYETVDGTKVLVYKKETKDGQVTGYGFISKEGQRTKVSIKPTVKFKKKLDEIPAELLEEEKVEQKKEEKKEEKPKEKAKEEKPKKVKSEEKEKIYDSVAAYLKSAGECKENRKSIKFSIGDNKLTFFKDSLYAITRKKIEGKTHQKMYKDFFCYQITDLYDLIKFKG